MLFHARQFEFRFPRPAMVMGIVNVTPDSFSDGGKFLTTNAAVKHALKLVEAGAEILDIGGESTRPGAKPVSEKEELRRVIPVIQKLSAEIKSRKTLLSIDTMKPSVARAALEAGANIVNDVAAFSRNGAHDEMLKAVAEFRAGYIVMHAHKNLHEIDPQKKIISEVEKFFRERLKKLKAFGISREQIIFDPGIGFGKSLEQNLQLLAALKKFSRWQRPLLLGVSRKSFIEKISGAKMNERLPASLACATLAIAAGVNIIRVHDVAETMQAARMTEAILAQKSNVGIPGK